ncbi:hypothetical protein A3G56_02260 [Candidatus Falkowbacteria bacterium RIFCSPLOWO2_12_FULL_45_10]|uniref:Uncharacterized protein n=3 Tax=Candidatus Falkowiibacteriota TaxID=1752728 RepID=A0A1F5RL81_9BACT|nr:MAG: hypothetical protein A3D54_01345 [Candidatus Falkowbacteria bacterium RIFCSPHIGHO2_02_FULL_45_15]OGF18614.1 MAG: hypothetical protein A3G56_02260 [Candidatus Falkowbacteria bacterium RIFCSPLOWO2_12_FULL_45_10]OGF19095.1 MAG: hypothetical protein A3I35_02470 [Candidatus Falkowbacteria bacterium RIFCSPLOWO2_02_FULL_45_15]
MKLYIIIREIFYALTITLFIFIVMEFFFPDIVQAYFSLNFVLILWILSGIVLLLIKKHD